MTSITDILVDDYVHTFSTGDRKICVEQIEDMVWLLNRSIKSDNDYGTPPSDNAKLNLYLLRDFSTDVGVDLFKEIGVSGAAY